MKQVILNLINLKQVLSRNDTLHIFGNNDSGQLATNLGEKDLNIVTIDGKDIWLAACGGFHTLALGKKFSTSTFELKKLLQIQQNALRSFHCLKEIYYEKLSQSRTNSAMLSSSFSALAIPLTSTYEKRKEKLKSNNSMFFLEKDVKQLFRNLDQLISANSQFYYQLDELFFNHFSSLNLGKVLKEYLLQIRPIYVNYFDCRESIDEKILFEFATKPEVNQFLKQCQEKAEQEYGKFNKTGKIDYSFPVLLKSPLEFLKQFSLALTLSLDISEDIDELKSDFNQLIADIQIISNQEKPNSFFQARAQKDRLQVNREQNSLFLKLFLYFFSH